MTSRRCIRDVSIHHQVIFSRGLFSFSRKRTKWTIPLESSLRAYQRSFSADGKPSSISEPAMNSSIFPVSPICPPVRIHLSLESLLHSVRGVSFAFSLSRCSLPRPTLKANTAPCSMAAKPCQQQRPSVCRVRQAQRRLSTLDNPLDERHFNEPIADVVELFPCLRSFAPIQDHSTATVKKYCYTYL